MIAGGGWIGEFYTHERLLEVVDRTYSAAMLAYRELVERCFATLADSLETYVLMPFRFVGEVSPGVMESGGFGPVPGMAWHLEPLPPESDGEVSVEIGSSGFNEEVADRILDQQRRARPQAARWLSGTYSTGVLDVGDPYAISDVVYRWLASDLKRLGLAGSTRYTRKRDVVTRFVLS